MVRTEWRDRVLVVTLDRPERRNAVDHATLLALEAAQREAREGGARVLVLTGAPPAFCAGADLTGVESGEFVGALVRALEGFTSLPFVTMAAVDGAALGAGTQLAVACDLRVASPTSQFGIPAAKLGLAVDRWTIERAASELGPAVARAMLLAAEVYTGEQLHRTGGVHRTGHLADALGWAEQLADLAPLTIAAHKAGLEAGSSGTAGLEAGSSGTAGLEAERLRVLAWASADAEEGRRAFLEKRRPVFRGE